MSFLFKDFWSYLEKVILVNSIVLFSKIWIFFGLSCSFQDITYYSNNWIIGVNYNFFRYLRFTKSSFSIYRLIKFRLLVVFCSCSRYVFQFSHWCFQENASTRLLSLTNWGHFWRLPRPLSVSGFFNFHMFVSRVIMNLIENIMFAILFDMLPLKRFQPTR